MPALEEESGSEAVALDEDTDLESSEFDLAIDDMVRGAVHGACPVPVHIIARLHEWLDGYDATACTDPAQLRGYVNRLRCA